jgi:hypothetical protein
MQMQVETNVGWFSLFQWEPSRSSFRFSERESEVFPHRDYLPVSFLPLEIDLLKTSECISWIFFDGVLKHVGTSFQGVSQCFPQTQGNTAPVLSSLDKNRVRSKKNLQKSTLAFNWGSNSKTHHFLCSTEFHSGLTPSSPFPEASTAVGCIFVTPHVQLP